MTERNQLLASMYDDEATILPVETDHRIRTIRVGPISYEVPSLEYVRQLEQIIQQQRMMINQQQRAISRLEALMHGTRGFVRRHGEALNDLRFDVGRKADHV